MNQCILMAEVIQPAQTRYTPDQTAIAEAIVQYPGLRPDDPVGTLKIVGWGNMAQEVQEQCQPGQWFIFEGRLRINTVERAEGFKEKLVELSVSKIHSISASDTLPPAPATAPAEATPKVNPTRKPAPAMATVDAGVGGGVAQVVAPDEFDDIPF